METIKTHLKVVALFFSVLILLQGCTVYKSANVSLEQAVWADTKVIVKENNSKAIMFDRIEVEDGNYFGIKKFKGDIIKMRLDEDNLSRISLKNKTMSTILTAASPVALIGVSLVIYLRGCE